MIISEAYSARNVGDAELVYATIERVAQEHAEASLSVVALDPESFEEVEGPRFMPRLFDRRVFAQSSPAARVVWSGRWAAFMALESARAVAGRTGPSKVAARLVGAAAAETYRAYMSSGVHVAVGGGYLGDRYIKESMLTLWSWWWSCRRGLSFSTMPISIEADGRLMRLLLRTLMPKKGVVVRDEASLAVLAREGLTATLEPDLAFRNYSRDDQRSPKDMYWLFPVGSDYFHSSAWETQWEIVARVCGMRAGSLRASSMHVALDGVHAGGDAEVVEHLARKFSSIEPYSLSNYRQLVAEMRSEANVVVSARMHAGIAALCAGVPLVLLGYEEKHRTLMKSLGLSRAYLPMDRFTSEDFERALEYATSLTGEQIRAAVEQFLVTHSSASI